MGHIDLLQKAEKIWRAGLAEVEPKNLIQKSMSRSGTKLFIQGKRFDLSSADNVYVVSVGKAGPFMAKALLEVLGGKIREGIVVSSQGKKFSSKELTCFAAGHPLPDRKSLKAAEAILALARKAGEKDIFFVLLSGGGSAQVCFPAQGVTLQEKRNVTRELLFRGANIFELNTVRKHLSAVKGGRLAQAVFPAAVINLVVSDVTHDDPETIASGPTCWDSSTYADALCVLKKYKLWGRAPASIKEVIRKGIANKIEETLRKENPVFKNVFTFVIGTNLMALEAAKRQAESLGFETFILTSSDQGEAREAAKGYVSLLSSLLRLRKRPLRPLCLLAGGELTVKVSGQGKGGRNLEFVLAALQEIGKKLRNARVFRSGVIPGEKKTFLFDVNWLVASLGTDGIDGMTDAAGAWIMPSSLEKARELNLDPQKYLDRNDSYHFFKKVGGLVITGPTQTNVMDLRLFLLLPF